jgi:hypothetical protein
MEKKGEKLRWLIHRTSFRGLIIFALSVWDSTVMVLCDEKQNYPDLNNRAGRISTVSSGFPPFQCLPTTPNKKRLFTWLLPLWNRVFLAELTGLLLVKKFPTFYGTRRFIIAVTCARHLSFS